MTQPSSPARPDSHDPLLTGLLGRIRDDRPDADTRLVRHAYEAAAHWHEGQRRRSGDPYITHPVAVAAILANAGADDETLCAALLHDTVEHTPYTLAAMRDEFGAGIAGLVEAVMTLDRVPVTQITAICADVAAGGALASQRALMIKVADRLHNVRTIRHLPRARQVVKSRQALDVMVPLARALGMETIGAELESLASATLRRRWPAAGTTSGRVLAVTAALLPPGTRDRWREEWQGEMQVLQTRRERVRFAIQIVLGIGRLAATLYQPAAAARQAFSAVLTAAVAASGLVAGGWRAAVAAAAAVIAILGAAMWVLRSDDRTRRLAELLRVLHGAPSRQSRPGNRNPDIGNQK